MPEPGEGGQLKQREALDGGPEGRRAGVGMSSNDLKGGHFDDKGQELAAGVSIDVSALEGDDGLDGSLDQGIP